MRLKIVLRISIKITTIISFLVLLVNCQQKNEVGKEKLDFSVAHHIMKDSVNQNIAGRLENFLITKNQSPTDNQYWLPSDFDEYLFPYVDLYKIEKDSSANYKVELLEIIDIELDSVKLVKFACFKEMNDVTSLMNIYNVLAVKSEGQYFFSRSLQYNTRNWTTYQHEDFTYVVSPERNFNIEEAKKQQVFKDSLMQFFGLDIPPITYYSCISPVELFEIKGYDYVANMYMSKSGGLAEVFSGIIFSGNDSERYDHELVHFFTRALFQHDMIPLFHEGIATYLGGSGGYSFTELKVKLWQYLNNHPNIELATMIKPYDRKHLLEDQLDAVYVVGALVCEYVMNEYGKEQLISLLDTSGNQDLWIALEKVNLNKENFSKKLLPYLNS